MRLDLPPPTIDPAEARDRADDLLSDPKYRQSRSIVERAFDWITERLGDLISRAGVGAGPGRLVALVVCVALAAVLVRLLWRVRPTRRVRPLAVGATVTSTGHARSRSVEEWISEADACAAAGDVDGAIRARWRAAGAGLVRAGIVDDVPARTTGELRSLLERDDSPLSPVVAELGRLFELAWYGPTPATGDDLRAYLAAEPALWRALDDHRRAPEPRRGPPESARP